MIVWKKLKNIFQHVLLDPWASVMPAHLDDEANYGFRIADTAKRLDVHPLTVIKKIDYLSALGINTQHLDEIELAARLRAFDEGNAPAPQTLNTTPR